MLKQSKYSIANKFAGILCNTLIHSESEILLHTDAGLWLNFLRIESNDF